MGRTGKNEACKVIVGLTITLTTLCTGKKEAGAAWKSFQGPGLSWEYAPNPEVTRLYRAWLAENQLLEDWGWGVAPTM